MLWRGVAPMMTRLDLSSLTNFSVVCMQMIYNEVALPILTNQMHLTMELHITVAQTNFSYLKNYKKTKTYAPSTA